MSEIVVGGSKRQRRWPFVLAFAVVFAALLWEGWWLRNLSTVLALHHSDLQALATHVKCTKAQNGQTVCPGHRYMAESEEPIPTIRIAKPTPKPRVTRRPPKMIEPTPEETAVGKGLDP